MHGLVDKWFSQLVRTITKRAIRIVAVALVVAIGLLVIFPGYVAAIIGPPLDRMQAHRALTHAHTLDELHAAVGHWGAVFPLRDGSWVAVRYTDSHAFPGYSYAVAHDSGGQWFYSKVHFCGRFRIYFQVEKQTRELTMGSGETEEQIQSAMAHHDAQLFGLATATNLSAARAQLLKMGFQQ